MKLIDAVNIISDSYYLLLIDEDVICNDDIKIYKINIIDASIELFKLYNNGNETTKYIYVYVCYILIAKFILGHDCYSYCAVFKCNNYTEKELINIELEMFQCLLDHFNDFKKYLFI